MQVELTDVTYDLGGRVLFAGLSATFHRSQFSAVVGPSGSGKSTLLALISGSLRPTTGTVVLTDQLTSRGPGEHYCVWVPQGLNALGARSVIDNVALAALADGRSRDEAADMAATHLAEVGLRGKEYQVTRSLSGGELQRVSVARALTSCRPLVLADEPTANLDAANTEQVAELLRTLAARKTIIVATHDLNIASHADSVVSLA